MNIQKYNPFNWFKDEEAQGSKSLPVNRQNASHPFLQLHQEIDRLFDDAFRSFGVPSLGGLSDALERSNSLLRPNVNISESDREYKVTVEVPGVDENDVKLELIDRTLTISGEKKIENEEKEKNFCRVERSYGSFKRVLSLPEDVHEDDIEAEFKNGVLSLTLPRKALSKSDVKRIDIKKVA